MIVKDIKNAKILGSDISKIMSSGNLIWDRDAYYAKELEAAAESISLPYSYSENYYTKIYHIHYGTTVQVPKTILGHKAVNVTWSSRNTSVVTNSMRVVGTIGYRVYLVATLTMEGTTLQKEVFFFCEVN